MTQPSLTATTVHGLKWSYASTVVTVALQIGVTAVLARVLTPSAFGLVAMATVFLSFGQYFAQMGAGQAIVQRPQLSGDDVRTAFTSSLLIGVAFWAAFFALAPLAGALFPQTPDVVRIARVMSLTFALGGVTATTQGLLRRRFAFRAIAIVEIVSFVLGYAVVGLTLALSGLGVWSLVAAALGQATLAAAMYVQLCRRDLGFALRRSSLRAIYSFGGRVTLVGFAEFISFNLDKIWTGHFLGSQAMGLYTRATNIAGLPLYYLTTGLSRVLLPGFSRIQSETVRLRSVYVSTIAVVGAIVMPVSWGVAAASSEVIVSLLGSRWSDAVPALAVLALAVPFTLLTHFGAIVCEATATLNPKIVISVGKIVWLTALLLLLARFGITGVAVAYALSELTAHAAYLVVTRRLLDIGLGELRRAYSVGLVSGVVTGLVELGLHAGLARLAWPPVAILAAQLVAGALCLLVTVTRARSGAVWSEIRCRLAEAGYEVQGKGFSAWLIRRMDALT